MVCRLLMAGVVVGRVAEETRLHIATHRDWLRGRCRFVCTRSFPYAGFEYPVPRWDREREPGNATC